MALDSEVPSTIDSVFLLLGDSPQLTNDACRHQEDLCHFAGAHHKGVNPELWHVGVATNSPPRCMQSNLGLQPCTETGQLFPN